MVICRSAAWESGMVTSAWWAHAHQVSKSGAGGVYLPVGTFAPNPNHIHGHNHNPNPNPNPNSTKYMQEL